MYTRCCGLSTTTGQHGQRRGRPVRVFFRRHTPWSRGRSRAPPPSSYRCVVRGWASKYTPAARANQGRHGDGERWCPRPASAARRRDQSGSDVQPQEQRGGWPGRRRRPPPGTSWWRGRGGTAPQRPRRHHRAHRGGPASAATAAWFSTSTGGGRVELYEKRVTAGRRVVIQTEDVRFGVCAARMAG
jgi:hypothetical protein